MGGAVNGGTELERQLKEVGLKLLDEPLPSSIEDLLKLIDRLEAILLQIGQEPSRSMQDALFPSMSVLIAPKLFKHTNGDVRVSVTSCLIEIMRITAPHEPYREEILKEIFKLAVEALECLSHTSTRSYVKAISILDSLASVRSCVMMLDLQCDELIAQMFRLFFSAVRYKHASIVVLYMETVMATLLDDSDDIPWELLSLLLASVRKKDQDKSSTSWKLGEKVLSLSAKKLKPYLLKAVRDMNIVLDEYAPIVAAICKAEIDLPNLENKNASDLNLVSKENDDGNSREMEECTHPKNSKITNVRVDAEPDSLDSLKDDNSNIQEETGLCKRGRKPNPLINSEEGYDPWVGRKTPKKSHLKITGSQRSDGLVIGCPVACKSAAKSKNGKSSKSKPLSPKSSQPKKKEMLKPDASHEEKAPQSDIKLEKEQKSAKTSEIKRKKRSTRAEIPSDSLEKTTPENEEMERNGNDGSSAQIGSEQKSLVHDIPAEVCTDLSSVKKKTREGKEAPKTKPRRKQSAVKDEVSGTLGLDAELVGKRIEVWWPMDKIFYEGVVDSYDDTEKKHTVLYTDGENEVLNLKTEKWKLMDYDFSSNMLKEKISRKKPKKIPQGKADSNSKKGKNMSSGIPETAVIKLGNQVVTDEPMKNPTNSEKSAEKLKIGTPSTDTDSETTPSFRFERIRSADGSDEVCKPDGEKSNCAFEEGDYDSSKMDEDDKQSS